MKNRIWTFGVEFEPRDLWIGLYWDRAKISRDATFWNFYVCIVPTVVLHLSVDVYAWETS